MSVFISFANNGLSYTELRNGDIIAVDGVGTVYSKINNRFYRTTAAGKKTKIDQDVCEAAFDDIKYFIFN